MSAPLPSVDALSTSTPSASDLSAQVLAALFGSDWHSLAGSSATGSGAVLGDLLFGLFGVLNCCCAAVVAWLFILTTLSATLGAAQDGRGIGGARYSNAWIPLRYSFAMGAITPVFNGLNAMQVLMLAAISVSVQFADAMWETGVERLENSGAVAARSEPVVAASAGRVLPVLVTHHVLKDYFVNEEMCAVAGASRKTEAGWTLNRYEISFEFPPLLNCPNLRGDDGFGMTLNPALGFGDFGGVTVSTPVREASENLARALGPDGALYKAVGERVREAVARGDESAYAALDVAYLADLYRDTVSGALKEAAASSAEKKREAFAAFREQAAARGWWMAGSHYWSLAKTAADSVEAMRDRTTASPVNLEALSDFMNPDLERRLRMANELAARAAAIATQGAGTVNPVSGRELVAAAGGESAGAESAAPDDNGSVLSTLAGFFSGASHAVSEFALDEKAVGTSAIGVVAGHDLVFNTVRAARTLMNVCENAVVTYLTAKLFVHSVGSFLKNPVTGAVAEAAEGAVDLAGKVALAIAAPVWAVCWFYAYMLPMLPFISWFAAIVGWLVLCVEALAACPLWLVAHCMPEGDGFAGASARAGYALLLSVLLRPLLLVLAFFVCMAVMAVSGSFMGALLIPFFDAQGGAFDVGGFGTSGWGVTASITTVLLVGLVCGIATWKLFSLVALMPDRVIRWAGQLLANLGDFHAQSVMREGRYAMDGTAGRILPAVAAGSAITAVANAGSRTRAASSAAASAHALGSRTPGRRGSFRP